MKIAILQPPYPSDGTIAAAEDCITWMRQRLEELAPGAQDLVLLPEYATTPGLNDGPTLRAFAAAQGAAFLNSLAETAARLGGFVALSAATPAGARWFNRTLVLDVNGDIVAAYDKVHLTDAEKEDLGMTAGSLPVVREHDGVRIGFATCFDLYFAEHFATLAADSADLVLCPSYQRSETPARICSTARVRALDSGTYLVRGSYAMGTPHAGGHSLVAAPDGSIVADAGSDPEVLTAEVDVTRKFVKPASHGQPDVEHRSLIESHRRPTLYRPHGERARRIASAPFPHLCAHRGLSQACPENTIPAFAAAVACGVHEIEFDVWLSRDGVLVVCHDPSVDRTTDGTGTVTDLDWADIQKLDAGAPLGEAWRGVSIPRVEEVLEVADGRVRLNIHIKPDDRGQETVTRVCDLLIERGLTEHAYLALETEADLKSARDHAPDIERCCLDGSGDQQARIDVGRRHGCRRIQFPRQVEAEHLRRAHDEGMICGLFWSDEPDDARAYVRDGVDVVLTNCAHVLIAGGLSSLHCPHSGSR